MGNGKRVILSTHNCLGFHFLIRRKHASEEWAVFSPQTAFLPFITRVSDPSLSPRFPRGFKSRRLGFQDVDLYVEQRIWPHKPSGEKEAPEAQVIRPVSEHHRVSGKCQRPWHQFPVFPLRPNPNNDKVSANPGPGSCFTRIKILGTREGSPIIFLA